MHFNLSKEEPESKLISVLFFFPFETQNYTHAKTQTPAYSNLFHNTKIQEFCYKPV